MKNLGPILFTLEAVAHATAAAANGTTLDVPRNQWSRAVKRTPAIGHLFWVQEPCVLYKHKKTDMSQIVFGGIITARAPDGWRLDQVRKFVDDGSSLQLRQSRYTLEIKDAFPGGLLRCAVHAENIKAVMAKVAR